MTTARKTWISIAIASVIVIGMLAAAAVGSTIFFVYRHVHSQFTGIDDAQRQFEAARARLVGQQPLIELRDDEPVLHRDVSSPRHDLRALHALAYDEAARKLVRVDVPIWLLRLVPSANSIHFSDLDDLDDERAHLTLEDLERHGPGLVLDARHGRTSRVLVWTE